MKIFFLTWLVIIPTFLFPQTTSQDVTKDKNKYVFAQIYAGFYYGIGIWSPRAKCGGKYGMYEVYKKQK